MRSYEGLAEPAFAGVRMVLAGVVAVGALCAAMAFAASGASAETFECGPITGSGSPIQAAAQESIWGPTWEAEGSSRGYGVPACAHSTTMRYKATTSDDALDEWGAEDAVLQPDLSEDAGDLDAVIGTDIAPEASEQNPPKGLVLVGSAMNNMDVAGGVNTGGVFERKGMLTLPVAQYPVAVVVSLPVGCEIEERGYAVASLGGLVEEWSTDGA